MLGLDSDFNMELLDLKSEALITKLQDHFCETNTKIVCVITNILLILTRLVYAQVLDALKDQYYIF